jgi:hypothetical protein
MKLRKNGVGSALKFQRGVIREYAVFRCAGCDKRACLEKTDTNSGGFDVV